MPSVGPQLQALACTLVYACRLEHFSTWYGLMAPWPFTDCGLVNLVRALVQAGSGPVSVGRGRAQQAAECTGGRTPYAWVCIVTKAVYWRAVSIDSMACRSCSLPVRRPLHIADSPMTLGRSGVTGTHAAPGLSLSPSLRAACVCALCCVLRHRAPSSSRVGSRLKPSRRSLVRRELRPPCRTLGAKTTANSHLQLDLLLLSWVNCVLGVLPAPLVVALGWRCW
jgi:hypothetical protein